MLPVMSGRNDQQREQEERERDELLKRLLKTPPQPRPKREREDKPKPDSRRKPNKKAPDG